MAKINSRQLMIQIAKPLDRACRRIATAKVQEKFDDAKATFLKEFINDPVSEEIEAGAKAAPDVLPVGNLFSFIGFEAGTDPIGDLLQFFEDNIKLNSTPIYDANRYIYNFKATIPSKDDIKEVTPMPWGTARSWAFAIESGIQGLNHYLVSNKRDLGRSTGGIQVKGQVNDVGAYTARKYMSSLLNDLKELLS